MAFRLVSYAEKEHDAQVSDCRTLRILLRPGVAWTAVDHGHSINPTIGRNGQPIGLLETKKRIARGVRSGVPDMLFWADGRGFAIERKVPGGRLSEDQLAFHEELRAARVPIETCWSQREVCDVLTEWGLLRPYRDAA